MSRRYDGRTTTFSPEGRLFQVEYALEAIGNAIPAVGILAKDGVVIVVEKDNKNKLLAPPKRSEKTYLIDDHILCAVAGLTADADILIARSQLTSQQHMLRYQEHIPIENLLRTICNYKQAYTQFGGQRPFGVSFLYAGWDKHYGFQLYASDPSGNYDGWKAHAIGLNHKNANSMLQSEYKEDLSVDDALRLAVKVMNKTMDTTTMTPERLEFCTLKRENDKVVIKTLSLEETKALVAEVEVTTSSSGDM